MALHVPVLLREVQEYMQPRVGGVYVDATLGHGGHAQMLLQASAPTGRVIGLDRDERNLSVARERVDSPQLTAVHEDYRWLSRVLVQLHVASVDGVLLDVGFSSAHVDEADRGFSFQQEGPLDMRYDRSQTLTAEEIVRTWSEADLARIFTVYGEEPQARRLAHALCEARRRQDFETTTDLSNFIVATLGRRGKLHPATRAFQALRIAVNAELDALQSVLPQAVDALHPGGRLCVISFHSLEDRIVKRFLKSRDDVLVLTKTPIVASLAERRANPRARSAKLRVAEKQNTQRSYESVSRTHRSRLAPALSMAHGVSNTFVDGDGRS